MTTTDDKPSWKAAKAKKKFLASWTGQETVRMKEAIGPLSASEEAFWSAYVGRIQHMHSLQGSTRGKDQWLRLFGLMAGAVVPALAGFTGTQIRIVIAIVGGLAVVFHGASAIYGVDARLSVNRKYECQMLDIGWRFVTGPTTGFDQFEQAVEAAHVGYTTEYNTRVDSPSGANANQ